MRFVKLADRQLIEISGKDHGTFLQGLFSQDVAKNFPVGAAVYGIFPNAKGKILADAFILHADSQRFLLDIDRAASEKLLAHLNQYLFLSDVKIEPRQERLICIFDGSAPAARSTRSPANLQASLQFAGSLRGKIEDCAFMVSRKGFMEQRIWIPEIKMNETTADLKQRGAAEINPEIYEAVLAEHLIPKLGREMDETTFPQEVGLEEALNLKKGCFIGAEVLQRIFYQGHVNRKLVLVEADKPPESGKITFSFENDGKVFALALVKSN